MAGIDQLVEDLERSYAETQERMSDPAVYNDHRQAAEIGRKLKELEEPARLAREWRSTTEDLEAAREDGDLRELVPDLETRARELEDELRVALAPRDPADSKDVLLEVRGAAGGDEAALWAAEVARMLQRYAERRGFRTETLSTSESEGGGIKETTFAVKGDGAYSVFKFEGGTHRVQRVPVTESQGRIHTSAAGVLVLPEAEEVDVTVDPNDLRIDVYRSSGPGGQSVNTTDSAVRITHLPTGIVVSCQNEKSQLQNKEQALRILRARLLVAAQEEADAAASDARKSQVRTVDRSERIRTYNYPENRISDHRVNFKAYNLDQVLDGDLDAVIDALVTADNAARLAGEA
jgi:peptide chain release factor 1